VSDDAPAFEPAEIIAVENLARTEALSLLGWTRAAPERPRRAVVFAGRSSAGAAALAVVRHLSNFRVAFRALVCGPDYRLSPLAAAERRILEAMRVPLEEDLDASALGEAAAGLGADDALVDGAGSPAPGREDEFAAACRSGSNAARTVRIDVATDYSPPAPVAEDTLFSPDAPPRSREDVRLLDSTAIERYRIPGVVLMENAGWRAAREAWAMLGFGAGGGVLVLAGGGNNGGDGFVLARHLKAWGADVRCILVAARERVMDDALTNLKLAEAAGVEVRDAALPEVVDAVLPAALDELSASDGCLVVDALLGTGLSGRVRGAPARAIELLDERRPRLLAVDTPSGLDANTGEVLGAATTAERTVTFAFPKLGFTEAEGPARTGEVVVADISMPRELWEPDMAPLPSTAHRTQRRGRRERQRT
jgi:NAD(P)H-hydrate epimerase